mgnify:CR=1 FL=1
MPTEKFFLDLLFLFKQAAFRGLKITNNFILFRIKSRMDFLDEFPPVNSDLYNDSSDDENSDIEGR